MEKYLGKISSVKFGIGGYNDGELGLHLSFSFGGRGTSTSKSYWDCNKVEHSEYCQWSEEDRSKGYDEIMRFLSDTLNDAKCKTVDELLNKPVEVTFEDNLLKSWRILTEVL